MSTGKRIRILLLLALVGSYAWYSRHSQAEDPRLVKGSGTVEATEIGVAAQATGRITKLLAAEGDEVKAGQLLAELNRDALQGEYERTQAATFTARMSLANLVRGSRSEEVRARRGALLEALAALQGNSQQLALARTAGSRPPELKAALDAAEAQLKVSSAAWEQAQAAVREAKAGSRPQELAAVRAARAASAAAVGGASAALAQAEASVRSAEAAVGEADAGVAGAESDVAQAQQLLAERGAATTQVAAAQTSVETTAAALAAARARQELVDAPPRSDRREQIVQQLTVARAAAELAQTEATRQKSLFEAGAIGKRVYDQAVTTLDQARAAVRQAEAAVKDLDVGARDMERREAAALVSQAGAAAKGAETALGNARHEQAILVTAAQQQLDRAKTALAQVRRRREQAVAGLDLAKQRKAQAETALEQAAKLSDQGQAQLDLAVAGTREERLEQASAAARAAEASHAGAVRAAANAKQAWLDRFTYRTQIQAGEQAVAVGRARVEQAQAALDLALAGNTTEVLQTARGQLKQALAAEATAKARVEDTFVRAPCDGTVSELILRQGEQCTPGSVVVKMLDLAHLWVRLYLPVPAMTKIKRGQSAEVQADALGTDGKPLAFTGKVLTVSDQAEFTPKNTQTVEERVKQVFWVKVDVGDGHGKLKPGVPVDVRFRIGAGH